MRRGHKQADRSRRCSVPTVDPGGGHDGRRPRSAADRCYCSVDDLLPARAANARRRITDQEVITLCIAQAMLDCRSDEQFLQVARRRLRHLFPYLPSRDAFHKRRLRLSAVIEGLIAEFARHSPGFYDELVLVDSTPVECARSVQTTRRSQLADAADYATAPATAASSGASGCTRCSRWTAPRARWR